MTILIPSATFRRSFKQKNPFLLKQPVHILTLKKHDLLRAFCTPWIPELYQNWRIMAPVEKSRWFFRLQRDYSKFSRGF
jgi:hypothetical protein